MKKNKLTLYILVAMILGIVVGYFCNVSAPDAKAAKTIAGYFDIISAVFLRLIKMIIAPLVFGTIVSGIAGNGDSKAIGRIGMRAMAWFLCASVISLVLGMVFVNLFQPGVGTSLPAPATGAATNLNVAALNFKDFVTNIFPTSFLDAMAKNSILQILIFSVFFGFAIASFKDDTTKTVVAFVKELVHIMLKVTDYVMRLAPLGVFAAMASCITVQGLGVLTTYGKFIGSFYIGLVVLWAVLIGAGYLFLRNSTWTLLKMIREPMLIAFSTASSEAAYPQTLESLERFGVKEKVSGFVLPLGYSFNLDGSMMYQAFAVIFIAQVYNIELSISKQIALLLVMMLTSKGMAGVARASLVVVAATLPMFNLPEAGLLLIMGIDQFLDMGRTATNVIGNSIATAVVAKWEGDLGAEPETEEDEEMVLAALPVQD
ncbi:dicarboxylate/amino acid:cation symporter [Geomonas sp. Red69]|uniref:Dicarboxylate/amino acid:cation symporter n=1 Tax=Geomonas diazotrophica TaxID=2843197 RepID=A0ABX8JNV0_9BACT|nr:MULTISPECIES: dicarboxylate/amino acid:cation symporter [Geomonas]MBU5636874.1 dicarboxylate/amino acid:cation symporter [Geomonas diazotrophica]QWV98771.1 dicarboxylate/amino acid:cation symporter [Geomonas nitrogeniifigens]QXE87928.1 dicarboxylate/amino acid:cation symporter [Geomonas nitrogeniifigens]